MVTGDRVSDLNVIITYICARVHTCKSMPLYPCACGGQDNLWRSVLHFNHGGAGDQIKSRSVGMVASAFPY